MSTILARNSSAEVWAELARTSRRSFAGRPMAHLTPAPCKAPDARALASRLPFLGEPLELVVPSAELRRSGAGTTTFVNKGILQPEACWHIVDDIGTESPAVCLAQFASVLSEAELIELACALAGRYCFAAKPRRSIVDAIPLTSVGAMRSSLESLTSTTGRGKALKALNWAIDGLGSPYETILYLLLCLPPRLGGLHLPKPVANGRIDIADRCKHGVSQSSYYPDLWWPEANLVAEYDSSEHHSTPKAVESDARRRNDLQALGLHVVTINRNILKDAVLFNNAYEQLRKAIGVARPRQTQEILSRRNRLRRELLGRSSPGLWR